MPCSSGFRCHERGNPQAAVHGVSPKLDRSGIESTLEQLCALQAGARTLDLGALPTPRLEAVGGYRSRFRSRGMEYLESRVYLPGDDIRSMDWRVTARSGRPHTKLYQEESERCMYLIVDQGASMHFGTRRAFKSVVAAEVAALLCWATVQSGDRVGALVYNGARRLQTRIRDGRSGVLPVLQALVTLGRARARTPALKKNFLGGSLLGACQSVGPGTLVVVISDFAELDADAEQALARLSRNNAVVAALVSDPLEVSPPPPGYYAVTDGRDAAVIDTGSADLRAAYEACFEQRRVRLNSLADRLGMTLMSLSTEAEPVLALGRELAAGTTRSRRPRAARGQPVV